MVLAGVRHQVQSNDAVAVGDAAGLLVHQRGHVGVAVGSPEEPLVDAREVAAHIEQGLLADRAVAESEPPAMHHGGHVETVRGGAPKGVVAAGVEGDAPEHLAGIDGVEDIAGIDVEPLHVAPCAGHDAEAGAVIGIPAVGEAAGGFRIPHHRQVHEHDVVRRDREVVHHDRAAAGRSWWFR